MRKPHKTLGSRVDGLNLLCATRINKGNQMINNIIENLKVRPLLWMIAVIDQLSAIMHFVFHRRVMEYHGEFVRFLAIENLLIGFVGFYLGIGIIIGNRSQKKAILAFSLAWWITMLTLDLSFKPDLTTASILKDYIPLGIPGFMYVASYCVLQIMITVYALITKVYEM